MRKSGNAGFGASQRGGTGALRGPIDWQLKGARRSDSSRLFLCCHRRKGPHGSADSAGRTYYNFENGKRSQKDQFPTDNPSFLLRLG